MADYREISQVYAQEGIKAALLVNSGAAVALLTQATDLADREHAAAFFWPMIFWVLGAAVSALLWVLAFLSTRYVDKSIDEENTTHLIASNRWMYAAVLGFVGAILLFCAGAITLAFTLAPA